MKLIFTFSFFLISFICWAQAPSYCIYLMSGDITVSAKGKPAKMAKLNQFLSDNQELKLGGKAQLTLVTRESKYLVLNTPGTYPVANLSQNLKNYPPGVTQKYVSLLWKDLVASQDNFSSVRKSASVGTMGGVHRGDDCGGLVFPTPGLHTSEDNIRFIWRTIPKSGNYELVILDDQLNDVLVRQVADTIVNVNIPKELGGKVGNFYWTVRVKTSCEIDPAPFEFVTKEQEEKSAGSEQTFQSITDPIQQLSAIDQLVKDGWIYRAFRYFDKLVKNNPGNKMLSGQYAMLLLQYGFSKEAEEVYDLGK